MKIQILLMGALILTSLFFVSDATAYEPMDLRVETFSNATYPDGHSVMNLTMAVNSQSTQRYLLFWDEKENYTFESREVLRSEIMISTSSDFVNWSGSRRDIVISYEDGTNSSSPAAAVDEYNKTIYVVWSEENKTSGNGEIYLGISNDGINWTSQKGNQVISNYRDSRIGDCRNPKIAAYEGYAYAVWIGHNTTINSDELYFGYYDSRVWSSMGEDYAISIEDGSNVQSADILVVNGSLGTVVWVFWTEFQISDESYVVYAANSTYPFGRWNTTIVSGEYSLDAYNVSAALADNGDIYLFWEQEVNESGRITREIGAKYFHSGIWYNPGGGNTYIISHQDGNNATNPRASGSKIGLFAVWDEYDEITGYRQIMIGNISANGNWTSSLRDITVTRENGDNIMPSVYVSDSGKIYVAWMHWLEENTKQRGIWDGHTLSADIGDVIPELFPWVFLAVPVLVYVLGKRKRA